MTAHRITTRVLAEAARAASRAPSVHNTQPWRWQVQRDWLDLYAEHSRQLTAADPDGRLLTISCGAALHHARLALAAEGWQPVSELLPTPGDPDHLARVRLGEHIGATAEAMRHYQTTLNRRTDRRPLTDSPVPPATLAAVRAAVEAEGAHLHLLPPEQVSELAVAAARADALAAQDDAARAELAHWVGGASPAGTGLPATSIPTQPSATHVPVRNFGDAREPKQNHSGDAREPKQNHGGDARERKQDHGGQSGTLPTGPGGDRAAHYTVIFGEQDTPAGWLRAGQALSAGWLAAAEHGLTVLPFSAPVEVAATRVVLRRLLAGLGHPYLVLRLGIPDPDHPGPPHTPRLDPAQTVEIVDGAGDG